MPATAITLQQAKRSNVTNFFFCQHITLIPTLRSLLDAPDNGIDAFGTGPCQHGDRYRGLRLYR